MPSAALLHLPDSKSASLILTHPTPAEKTGILKLNSASWHGPLSVPAYLRREEHLYNQEITRDGGITHWVLVDSAEPENERAILASCESIRKRALLAHRSEGSWIVDEVVSHGIGSVFCREEYRGRGYAGRMMSELAEALNSWQVDQKVPGRERCLFTMLYSDVGKKFYAAHGWHPFSSQHLTMPPLPESQFDFVNKANIPPSRPLRTEDLEELCVLDENILRRELEVGKSTSKVKIALLPDTKSMKWHFAREEFVAKELGLGKPEIKGAVVGDRPGEQAWCIWTRTWQTDPGSTTPNSTMYVLRLVLEGGSTRARQDEKVASLLLAAQREAAKWEMVTVQLWNPTGLILEAAQQAIELAPVSNEALSLAPVDREEESIACLRWHSSDGLPQRLADVTWSDVDWVGNEKYGWC